MTDSASETQPTSQAKIRVYTRLYCGYCTAAKDLLNSQGIVFDEIKTDGDWELREKIAKLSGQQTVPQIFVDDLSIGGYTELAAAMRNGEFQKLLQASSAC